jgi:hypothetical protein
MTDDSAPQQWKCGTDLLRTMCEMARDLKAGQLTLDPSMRMDVSENLAGPDPLRTRPPSDGVTPENIVAIVKWGKFDGSSFDLDHSPLPPRLLPGESVTLQVPPFKAGNAFVRMRYAYNQTNAGLKVVMGGVVLMNEIFQYESATGESNFSFGIYESVPAEVTRRLFIPKSDSTLIVSNPGTKPIYFDAIQIEQPTQDEPDRWIGMQGGFKASFPDGPASPIPGAVTHAWSVMRVDSRSQLVGAPGDPHRWDVAKSLLDRFAATNNKLDLVFMGTPEWAAITPQRYLEGKKAWRPHTVVPDTSKYLEIVDWVIEHYHDKVAVYEIWNEPDITQFWRGTPEEYIAFAAGVAEEIHRRDPEKPIILSGLANVSPGYIERLYRSVPSPTYGWNGAIFTTCEGTLR